jgi:hypothetical protein
MVAVVGGTVVLPLGLGILALEFAWARRWLERVRESSTRTLRRVRKPAWQGRNPTASGSD